MAPTPGALLTRRKATGAAWSDIFTAQIKAPLGLGPDLMFYTAPRLGVGTTNPLIAGGLRMSC